MYHPLNFLIIRGEEVMRRILMMLMVISVCLISLIWIAGCTSEEESEPAAKVMETSTVFLKHKVADYAAWRSLYDADAPRRAEAGLTEKGVYRDAGDENMILIAWETADTGPLKAMLAAPELAEKMKEAGVMSEPEIWICKSLEAGVGTVFITHTVADYEAWRPLYDADGARRAEAGLDELGVYRASDDENLILISWQAKDGAIVQAMLADPSLAEKMKEAGVMSKPEAWMGSSM